MAVGTLVVLISTINIQIICKFVRVFESRHWLILASQWRCERARKRGEGGRRGACAVIVLTENAVGFENGGERFSSNRETNPLYVSKVHALKDENAFFWKKRQYFCGTRLPDRNVQCLLSLRSFVRLNMVLYPFLNSFVLHAARWFYVKKKKKNIFT